VDVTGETGFLHSIRQKGPAAEGEKKLVRTVRLRCMAPRGHRNGFEEGKESEERRLDYVEGKIVRAPVTPANCGGGRYSTAV